MRIIQWTGLLLLLAFHLEGLAQTKVLFSHSGGFYDESFDLSLGYADGDCQIRYTINGGIPTASSKLYETPLPMDQSLYSTSDIYTLPISPLSESFVPDSVPHAIVIRAAAFNGDGQCVSEVATQTYLIRALGCDHHGMAVVSVCADSLALFDYDTGIFVPGAHFNPDYPDWTGNYYEHGREWERLCNVEFYEPGHAGLNQQCGLRTHGNRARKAAAKGMKLYAREEYGKKRFKYRFFETTPINSFNHLVLKPFSTLWPFVGVQDYLADRMAIAMGLEAPHSRPVAVYLNGEYWGIYFLQEKLDDRYLDDHFGIEPERCDIISGNGMLKHGKWNIEVDSGEGQDFQQMLDWLEEADLSDSTNYTHLKSLVDVDNLIDYLILELFIANSDWPANNFRCWRADDSPWRFAFFDGDAALVDTTYDALFYATYVANDRWNTGGQSTLLFRRLLENNDFKQKFKSRAEEWCGSVLRYENTAPFLDEVMQGMSMEIPGMIGRFGYPESEEYWNWGCALVREFLRNRTYVFQEEYSVFEPLMEHDYQTNTNDFVIYPNPTADVVHIMMLDGRSRVVDFVLCDTSGRLIINGAGYVSACTPLVIGGELSSGVYVVRIGKVSHRFVKY